MFCLPSFILFRMPFPLQRGLTVSQLLGLSLSNSPGVVHLCLPWGPTLGPRISFSSRQGVQTFLSSVPTPDIFHFCPFPSPGPRGQCHELPGSLSPGSQMPQLGSIAPLQVYSRWVCSCPGRRKLEGPADGTAVMPHPWNFCLMPLSLLQLPQSRQI